MFKKLPDDTIYGYPGPAIYANHPQTWGRLSDIRFSDFTWGATSIYIHIPYCFYLCQFCGFVKEQLNSKKQLDDYVELLVKEISNTSRYLEGHSEHPPISNVFFGGGTASVLSVSQIERILRSLDRYFDISKSQLSFEGEAISLGRISYLKELKKLGFNHVSFGIQTLDVKLRSALNIKPTIPQLIRAANNCSEFFEDTTVDFIYGWPGQSLDHLKDDVDHFIENIGVNSVEVFRFEKTDASPLLIKTLSKHGVLCPPTEDLIEQNHHLRTVLNNLNYTEASYNYYQKKMPYSTQASYLDTYYGYDNGSVIGIGRGAQSFYKGVMWGNTFRPDEYAEYISKNKLPVDSIAEYGFDERELVSWPRRGWINGNKLKNAPEEYQNKIRSLYHSGFICESDNMLRLTPLGVDWTHSIIDLLAFPANKNSHDMESQRKLEIRV